LHDWDGSGRARALAGSGAERVWRGKRAVPACHPCSDPCRNQPPPSPALRIAAGDVAQTCTVTPPAGCTSNCVGQTGCCAGDGECGNSANVCPDGSGMTINCNGASCPGATCVAPPGVTPWCQSGSQCWGVVECQAGQNCGSGVAIGAFCRYNGNLNSGTFKVGRRRGGRGARTRTAGLMLHNMADECTAHLAVLAEQTRTGRCNGGS